jgi:hypothetical protein
MEPHIPMQRLFVKVCMNFSQDGELEEEVNPLKPKLI